MKLIKMNNKLSLLDHIFYNIIKKNILYELLVKCCDVNVTTD